MGSAVRTPKSVGVRESSAESSGPSGPTIVTGPRITSVTARSAESAVSPLSSADARAGASASSALHGGSSDGAVGVMEKGCVEGCVKPARSETKGRPGRRVVFAES